MSKQDFLSAIEKGIARLRQAGPKVTIVHHNDADGLASAAVLQVALSRAGFAVQRIPLERVHPPIVARIHDQISTAILYVDLGGKAAPVISEANRGRRLTLILDHHHPEEATDPEVINLTTEFYGLSGEMDISAATAAYLFARVLDEGNRDRSAEPSSRSQAEGRSRRSLAYLGVVGALGDSHDRGGRLVGENRLALEDAVAQNQIRVVEVEAEAEQYILTRFGEDIPMAQFWRAITTLGAPGYYMDGPALGVRMCLEGPFREAQRKLEELNRIKQAAYEKVLTRLRREGLRETKYCQWFSVEKDFAPMGVKTIGEFCGEIRDADFVAPDKYIVGFQIMDREIPGLGIFDWSIYKVSMRVPSPLEKKIVADRTMPGLAYLVPEAARRVGGSIDACHDYSAATVIPVGREEELIAAMDALVEDHPRSPARPGPRAPGTKAQTGQAAS